MYRRNEEIKIHKIICISDVCQEDDIRYQTIPTKCKTLKGVVGPQFGTTCRVVKSVFWRNTPRMAE